MTDNDENQAKPQISAEERPPLVVPAAEETVIDISTNKKEEEERIYVAPPLLLMWWKFRKHKAALVSAVFIFLVYFIAIFCEFVAPYDPEQYSSAFKFMPPSSIHVIDSKGAFRGPFMYGVSKKLNMETLMITYVEDTEKVLPIKLFVKGPTYSLWGVFETNIHLFGLEATLDEGILFLFGSDRLGRDIFSRICYGARISLSIGLIGVLASLLLGVIIGGISGYYGGRIDTMIQRTIEFIRSIPQIPLWMSLSAALPADWPILQVYLGITIILSLISWTGLARVVRGRFLALREEDFVMAARFSGSSEMRIITVHMVPSFLSHIIASLTLSIPNMIISETGLSFIGLGLRAPAISWGVLLQEAQNIRSIALAPWVFAPAFAVIITVLAFNFLGDGLRDAADPYSR